MNVEVILAKPIPVEQISNFEDKTVYNTAVLTREYTKSSNAYPYLTGKLQKSEVAAPIIGSNKKYGLLAGVDYATTVWGYRNVAWTNPSTKPQWYYSEFREKGSIIVSNAVQRALKEV